MNLTDEQKAAVAQWVEDGAELGDIQSNLKEKFDVSVTYLDTRFLVGDLGLELLSEREPDEPEEEPAEEEAAEATPPEPAEDTEGAAPADEVLPPEGEPVAGGGVSVTVDQIAQPRALVSGKVQFSDGVTAAWTLDQMGQLGLDPSQEGYQPSEADIAAFQMELQNLLSQQGL